MHPKDKLNADLKEAMKSHDQRMVALIRNTLAAFKEAEQKRREELVADAIKKHGLVKPTPKGGHSEDDQKAYEAELNQYSADIQKATEAEKVEANIPLNEPDALTLLQKLIKMRQDSIADAQKAGRKDLEESELYEMGVLQTYLPAQMSREEIEAEAKAVIAQVGASSAKDMGKVMGPLMGKLKGRADSKLISDVVRALLP